jgi:prepilin-type N-terminal cleavage/methylation domain-containing protein
MINFLLKIKLLRKCKTFPTSNGMTYIELIVVLAIFATLSTLVMFNYGSFQDTVDIKNLASDIALQIVEAQKSSVNGVLPAKTFDDTWKPSYGVYFNLPKYTSANPDTDGIPFNKKFIYFTDLSDENGVFDGSSCPGGSSQECLNKITITKNNYISGLRIYYTDGYNFPLTELAISFQRPDSSARINMVPNPFHPSTPSYVQINIASSKGSGALIRVYFSGRVQII